PQPVPPTILLVEDETAVREVTREALEMGGYRVLEASGAQEATHIAEDRSAIVDLLLTDVVMPGMSGPGLARKLRQSPRTGHALHDRLCRKRNPAHDHDRRSAEPHPEAVYGGRSAVPRGRRLGRAMAQCR